MRNLYKELENAKRELRKATMSGNYTQNDIRKMKTEIVVIKQTLENMEDQNYIDEINGTCFDEDESQYMALTY